MNAETDLIRILRVEDDPADARLARSRLAEARLPQMRIVHVGLVLDAVAELEAGEFDVILLDLSLPDGIGPGAFMRIRAAAPRTPILILADRKDELAALKAVHAGAVDYLLKDQVTDILLSRAVRYAIERGRVDGALRQASEENDRLAAAVSNLTTGVIITDPSSPDNPIIFANTGFLRMTGYTAEDVRGRNPRFLQGPGTDRLAVAEIRQALALGRSCSTVLLNYRKDGTPFWNELTISPVVDDAGELIHYVGLQTDVTRRIDAERELAARNRELATLHRVSEISLSAQSPDRVFQEIAEEIAGAMGFSIVAIELYDEAQGRMVYRAAHGIPLPQAPSPLAIPVEHTLSGRVARTGEPIFTAAVGEAPDARDEILEALGVRTLACVPMVSDGRVIGTLTLADPEARRLDDRLPSFAASLASFIASVVERTRAQEALAAEGERLAVMLRSIAEGVVATDPEGCITLMNRVAEQLSGWEQDDAIGRPLTEVFRLIDERNRKPEDPVRRLFEARGAWRVVKGYAVLTARDGSEYVVAHSAAPLSDRSGATVGAVLVIRDITREREVEEELLKASKLESLGILAGGIAHDFNNLLTGILGHLSLLRANPDADDAQDALDGAENAARRAKGLTHQLLTFSRGGAPIRKPASLARVLRDSTRVVLHGSGIAYDLAVPDDLRAVEVDEAQIGQVIGNLLVNAQEAMPEGGRVHVSCENVTIGATVAPGPDPLAPGEYVRVVIRDEGTGIAPEHLPKIFDPYFSTRPNGSGLGLAAAYSIIRKHGGHIVADSEPGRGAKFSIYLPALDEPAPEAGEEEPSQSTEMRRVLVMDDDSVVLAVVSRMLERLGYAVDTATDGEAALERYRAAMAEDSTYDVVLMDLTIPDGMGGREAVGRLLEIDPSARAIVSSGYSSDPVMAEYRKYGFRAVMAKPYDLKELRRTIEEVISGAPAR